MFVIIGAIIVLITQGVTYERRGNGRPGHLCQAAGNCRDQVVSASNHGTALSLAQGFLECQAFSKDLPKDLPKDFSAPQHSGETRKADNAEQRDAAGQGKNRRRQRDYAGAEAETGAVQDAAKGDGEYPGDRKAEARYEAFGGRMILDTPVAALHRQNEQGRQADRQQREQTAGQTRREVSEADDPKAVRTGRQLPNCQRLRKLPVRRQAAGHKIGVQARQIA